MKSFREFIEAFDADAEAEKLQAKREEDQEKARAKRDKEKQERADKEAERQQKDDERTFITAKDLDQAFGYAERSNGRRSWLDILKRMKG